MRIKYILIIFTGVFFLSVFAEEDQQELISVYNTIAVMNLQAKGVPDDMAAILTERLRVDLVNLKTYRVMERQEMDKILAEQQFIRSDCVSNACAVEMGQIIGVSKIVSGMVGKIGKAYVLTARLIDVSTGQIIRDVSEEMSGDIESILLYGIPRIAQKLSGQIPAYDTLMTSQRKNLIEKDTNENFFTSIFVQVSHKEMEIFINGKSYGKGSQQIDSLPFGRYVVAAKIKGEVADSRIVNATSPEENYRVTLMLKGKRKIKGVISPQFGFFFPDLVQAFYFQTGIQLGIMFIGSEGFTIDFVSGIGFSGVLLCEFVNLNDRFLIGIGGWGGYWYPKVRDEYSYDEYSNMDVTPPLFFGPQVRIRVGAKNHRVYFTLNYRGLAGKKDYINCITPGVILFL